MENWRLLPHLRRDYGQASLSEVDVAASPIDQFKMWFDEVIAIEKNDPTSMVLSTVDVNGHPDSRVVLLKGIEDDAFVFYTNYQSTKAIQIEHNSCVALCFYWPEMARQVRIRGCIMRVSAQQSDNYFASRPIKSQIGAMISPQSQQIASRDVLEYTLEEQLAMYKETAIKRPAHWGGYAVMPQEVEFWQGRDNRLHDRINYSYKQNIWTYTRLAP